jgi:acyl-CoA synthetase (AMP-forming)/AMP-acid ligase II
VAVPGDLQVDQLRYMADRHPGEVAYRDLDAGATLSFAEWEEASNRLARLLVAGGVGPGDRVAIYVAQGEPLAWITAYAAVHKAAAVAVPVNTRLSAGELEVILAHAEPTAAVVGPDLADALLGVAGRLPTLRFVVTTGAAVAAPAETSVEVVGWHGLERHDPGAFQVPVGLDDLADIMYTSGTTGLPKGVAVRHRNVAMIPNTEVAWTGAGWLHGAPLFTFAGIAFIYNPMKMGLAGHYLPRFDAGRWLEVVERERPVMAFLVPAMAELLCAHPRFGAADLSSLRMVSIGSAPLAPATLRRLQERLPEAGVTNSYGLTEAGPAYVVMPKDEAARRVGSVGKPLPPLELRVVDEHDEPCPPGVVGEVQTRLPGRQREYFRDPDATAATWTADGWLRTGDLGYLDEDGFLYLVGRKKELIIRGGHNVYPTDVEAVLAEHPAVREAAVVGVPHEVLGEDIAAFVVTDPAAGPLDEEAVIDWCRGRLADYKCPRHVRFLAELPRNATGKVMKHRLTLDTGAGPAS